MINYADWLYVGKKDIIITVVAGSGTGTFDALGEITHIAILAVSAIAVYDVSIFDSDSFLIYASTGLTGNTAATTEKICRGINTFNVTNATVDGIYLIRLYGVLG